MFYRFDAMLATKIFQAKEAMKNLVANEEGDTNIISVILILVVVIGLAVLFKDNIEEMANKMWTNIKGQAGQFY